MIFVAGATFEMGDDHRYPEERPRRSVTVADFWLMAHPVTNHQFARFVRETGHVTAAERAEPAGGNVFVQPPGPVDLASASWWSFVDGASWRSPRGPGSSIEADHPVVQVAHADALAYAAWAGGRLPTEAEWERAATVDGGVPPTWPLAADGRLMANVWIGEFPWQSRRPNPPGTMPVGSFEPTSIGHVDLLGNVWEWTSTPADDGFHVAKGGSFLCAQNYCSRYRPSARTAHADDSPACHLGFRIARDG